MSMQNDCFLIQKATKVIEFPTLLLVDFDSTDSFSRKYTN